MAFSTFPDGGYTIGFSALPSLPSVGGSALPAARYWRLYGLGGQTNSGSSAMTMAEVEMAATLGGPNLCTGGTPIGTGGIGSPSNLFDGNPATQLTWSTANSPPVAGYILATAAAVAQFRLRASAGGEVGRMVQGFTPQYSLDNVTWVSLEPCGPTGLFTASEWRSFTIMHPLFAPSRATARLWRLSNLSGGNTIQEIAFRASAGGPSLCTGGFGYPSSELGGNSINGAFDADLGTKWVYSTPGTAWYFFPTAPNPTHLAVTGGTGGTAPSDWNVDWSYDGVTWTTVATITGQTGWGANETRVFAI